MIFIYLMDIEHENKKFKKRKYLVFGQSSIAAMLPALSRHKWLLSYKMMLGTMKNVLEHRHGGKWPLYN